MAVVDGRAAAEAVDQPSSSMMTRRKREILSLSMDKEDMDAIMEDITMCPYSLVERAMVKATGSAKDFWIGTLGPQDLDQCLIMPSRMMKTMEWIGRVLSFEQTSSLRSVEIGALKEDCVSLFIRNLLSDDLLIVSDQSFSFNRLACIAKR